MPKKNIKENIKVHDFDALYSKPLPSSRSGPLYSAFSYPTKISPESIALFIATHTKPGDVVLDVFGGSGTMGIAAKLCDKPTVAMKQMAFEMEIKPVWGPRTAILYEIGTLGSFISQVLTNPPESYKFKTAAKELISKARGSFEWVYSVEDPDGLHGQLRHAIWSDVLLCSACSYETTYWNAAVRRQPLSLEKEFKCPSCGRNINIDDCERATEVVYDSLIGKDIERKKRILVRVYGETDGKKWSRNPIPSDLALCEKIEHTPLPIFAPKAEIVWGDLYRTGYHKGISHLHHFYTPRNFVVITYMWNLIEEFDSEVRDALRLLVLSYNSTHSTLMTRIVVKKEQSDFVLTSSQSGVLYISGLPVEKNVFKGLERKLKHISEAFELVHGSNSNVQVVNASSTSINLTDNSVDYVFTDPPFGGNIPYAEINQINELWLGNITNRKNEVIVSKTQGKDINDYERLMATVFKEIARVLKPDGFATVVFHSAQSPIWQALTTAYSSAGFYVKSTSILDKLQESFKQVVSNIYVKGDPLILLSKINHVHEFNSVKNVEDIIEEIIEESKNAHVDESSPQRLYSRFVTRCLEFGINIPFGAKEFYDKIMVDKE